MDLQLVTGVDIPPSICPDHPRTCKTCTVDAISLVDPTKFWKGGISNRKNFPYVLRFFLLPIHHQHTKCHLDKLMKFFGLVQIK